MLLGTASPLAVEERPTRAASRRAVSRRLLDPGAEALLLFAQLRGEFGTEVL